MNITSSVHIERILVWAQFLEKPGNVSGPKANFKIITC